jgi:hypothetical protein
MNPRLWLLLGCALLVAAPRLAADDKEDPGEPGPEHKLLAKLAGTWDAKAKVWFEPGKPPTESTGVMKRKMIMGGRYLQEEYQGKFGPDDFTGMSIAGYDRVRKKFFSSWVDSMSTGVILSEGTYDAAKKTFTYINDDIDPATGKKMKGRDVLKVDNDDQLTFEMYRAEEEGKEAKVLEIIYTRRK